MQLSVIIPCFNDGKYLIEALASLQPVHGVDYEVIIINDGSTDPATLEILDLLSKKNIYTIISQSNKGLSSARNTGIKSSQGEYILTLDADNKIDPEYIYQALDIFENNSAIDIVYSDQHVFGLRQEDIAVNEFEISSMIFHNVIDACALYRKDVWIQCGGYDESLQGYEDWEFWLNAHKHGYKFFHINKPLYYYRAKTVAESLNSWCLQPVNFDMLVGKIYAKHNALIRSNLATLIAKLANAETLISTQKSTLLELEDTAKAQRTRLTALENTLLSKIQEIDNLKIQQKSLVWRTLKSFDRLLDVILGKNTFLRLLYNRILTKIQNFSLANYVFVTPAEHMSDSFFVRSAGKFKKFLAVIFVFPLHGIRHPLIIKTYLIKLLTQGPYIALQYAYDYAKLIHQKNNPLVFSQKHNRFYSDFALSNQTTKNERINNIAIAKSWSYQPKITIVIPIYTIDLAILKETIRSVKEQTYTNWELCISNTSGQPEIAKFLRTEVKNDHRMKIDSNKVNRGISENTNACIALATGEYTTFLDHDDMLSENALWENVSQLQTNPETDIIYSDEDKVDQAGQIFHTPYFKPDWSPDLFLTMNYLCHLVVMRTTLINELGGLRSQFDGAQDYDLLLRATEKTHNIKHIAKVLYHWRTSPTSVADNPDNKPYCITKGLEALQETLIRRKIDGDAVLTKDNRLKIIYAINNNPLISIIIPTRDKKDLVEACLASIIHKTAYKNYEIIIVDNNSQKQETKEYLQSIQTNNANISVIEYPREFNYSAINNFAVSKAKGELLVFLNNDTEVINELWLTEMLAQAQSKPTGVVGVKLYYPDKRIQHAGVVFLPPSLGPTHVWWYKPEIGDDYYFINCVRNYSAVTAACMMVRRDIFDEVGGFDESFPVAFNDVDLCLKIRSKGYNIVYTPYAELYHLESATRGFDSDQSSKERLYKKWGDFISRPDPFYNPNLSNDPSKSFEWRGY